MADVVCVAGFLDGRVLDVLFLTSEFDIPHLAEFVEECDAGFCEANVVD